MTTQEMGHRVRCRHSAGILGVEAFSPALITGHSTNTTSADSYLLQIFLECLSPRLTWTSSSSPSSIRYPLRTTLAGLPGGSRESNTVFMVFRIRCAELYDEVLAGGSQTSSQERNATPFLVRFAVLHSLHPE